MKLIGRVRREHTDHPAARPLPRSHPGGRVFDDDAISWIAGEQRRPTAITFGVGLALGDMIAGHNLRRCDDPGPSKTVAHHGFGRGRDHGPSVRRQSMEQFPHPWIRRHTRLFLRRKRVQLREMISNDVVVGSGKMLS